MLDLTKDIQPLTTFRRRSGDFLKQIKKSKRPVVLTVNGKAAAVVQDAEAYQRLLDIAARADAKEGIRQGLEEKPSMALVSARGRSGTWVNCTRKSTLKSRVLPNAGFEALNEQS